MQHDAILDHINSPEDVKKLDGAQLPGLCAELRELLIESVSKTGGHLASNLGAVELTVGIHRVFSSPHDKIYFDVGHQSYVHKLLTGRKDRFLKLRKQDGLSGFLRPNESEHDCFVSGHASNSISVALGMARGYRLRGEDRRVVCMIGDGALTGGMAFEALNDAGRSKEKLIVVFNDNDMSISKSVGALSERLSHMRSSPRYFRAKARVKRFFRRFSFGESLIQSVSQLKNRIKSALLKESIFEIMGFRYFGPADGNDITVVCDLLNEAKLVEGPVVVHFKTTKGKGYFRSESEPSSFHGVSAFDVVTGISKKKESVSFSQVFGSAMCALAVEDARVCAITAAMEGGTGLIDFAERFPSRFFDVGIAEEHAVTMSSAMATTGMLPVCAIYSTFLQRTYDQLIHDVAIQGNHVVFAIDRAGLVGEDGETHQGIFDLSFLSTVPGMRIFAPASHTELNTALRRALYECSGPVAVRYSRGCELTYREDSMAHNASVVRDGSDVTLISYGILLNEVIAAADLLAAEGISAEIVKLNELTGVPSEVIASVRKTGCVVVAEECVAAGGFAQKIASELSKKSIFPRAFCAVNLGDRFIPQGSVRELYTRYGIDAAGIVDAARKALHHE